MRRGFTLLEAIAVVVVLSLAVPPMLLAVGRANGAQADAVQLARAATLAEALIETVIADVQSVEPGLGFDALADGEVYVEAAGTGLRERMSWVSSAYESAGLTWEVEIGGLCDWSGEVTGEASEDVFRTVEVRVRVPLTSGVAEVPVTVRVTEVNG